MDPNQDLTKLRIFVSSPGDVAEERALTARVIKRLHDEFSSRCDIEPIFWEHEPLLATDNFQAQIVRPSQTEIVICILWSRLGTRLPASFARADGTAFQSGTEFEFEDAVQGRELRGFPDLLVYLKTADPMVSLRDETALLEKLQQRKALSQFVERWFHDQRDGTLIAAFHPFSNSAEYEEILEEHLRKLVDRKIPKTNESGRAILPQRAWTKGSPFRGLNVFEFDDSPIFFGRSRAVSAVLDNLRKQALKDTPFLLITGMSGCGKSSLVRAGVLPLLTEPQVIEGTREWRRAIFRPSASSGDLIDGLVSALLDRDCLPELAAGMQVSEISKLFRENPEAGRTLITTVLKFLKGTESISSSGSVRLVLAIDPLEEVFTDAKITPEARSAFNRILHKLVKTDCVWVIATLRSDFYASCEELPDLLALGSGDGSFHLSSPTSSEISQLVRRPAAEAGVRFERDLSTGFQLDDALVDAAAKDPNNLPLLEFTLDELYKQRTSDGLLTQAAFEALGGVEGALAGRAEEAFKGLPPSSQSAFSSVFANLVSVGSLEHAVAVRKPALLAPESGTPAAKEFIAQFVSARLLTADRSDDGQPVIRVAHEALLRHWPRLKNWIEENRDFLRLRARIENAALIWDEEQRSEDFLLPRGKPLLEATQLQKARSVDLLPLEQLFISTSIARANRRRHQSVGIAVVVICVALGLALWGIRYRRERSKPTVASKLAEEALHHRAQFDVFSLLAVQSYRMADTYETRNALLSALEANFFIGSLPGRWGVKTISFSPDGKTLAAGGWASGNQETLQLWDVATRAPIGKPLKGYTDTIEGIAFSPDGKLLVSDGSAANRGENTVRIWDVQRQQQVGASIPGYRAGSSVMSVSPEGNLIALTSGTDSTVLLWDLNKRKITGELKRSYKSSITNVVFSPDGKLLASIGTDQESYAHLWDSKTHKLLGDLDPDRYSVPFLYLIAFSPDGRMLAAAGGQGQGEILLWDVYTHRRLGSRINASATFVTSIAFSPDGSTLASGSLDGTVRLWDPVSHDLIATLAEAQKSKRVAASIAYSPDGKVLAWGNEADGTINLWDVSSYSRLAVGKPFEFYAYRLGFSPDGRVLATVKLGPKDHQTQLWDVASRQRLGEPIANVSRVRFSPDGNSLAAANDDDTVSLLGLADHSFSGQRLEGHVGDVQRIAFSPDGKTLATVGFDKTPQQHNVTLTQWNVATRKLAGPPVISPDLIQSHLAFSPDGATMVFGARLWDINSRQSINEIGFFYRFAFSPNGATLAASESGDGIRFWDIARRVAIGRPITGQPGAFYALDFSPDGKMLASGGADSLVRLWDVSNQQQLGAPLTGQPEKIEGLAFNQDGKILVSWSEDRTVMLWDVDAHKPLGVPAADIYTFAFSPHDLTMAVADDGNKVELWDLSTKSWADKLCGMIHRNLTLEEWREYVGSAPYEQTCASSPPGEGVANTGFLGRIHNWFTAKMDGKKEE